MSIPIEYALIACVASYVWGAFGLWLITTRRK